MQTATAPQMRKSLELAASLKQAMIRFVPIPVVDEVDHARLLLILTQRLEKWREETDCMNCDKCDTQELCPDSNPLSPHIRENEKLVG